MHIYILLTGLCLFILAGFVAWRDDFDNKPHFFCYHDICTGGGGMGDGVDCLKWVRIKFSQDAMGLINELADSGNEKAKALVDSYKLKVEVIKKGEQND